MSNDPNSIVDNFQEQIDRITKLIEEYKNGIE